MRKPADETDRVGDEVAPPVVLEAAGRRVECLEEAVVHRRTRAGERVQQGRLSHVRVAGERNGRRLRPRARLAADAALLAQVLQAPLQERNPPAGEATVGLQLALPRAPRADTAAEALQVLPPPAHSRQVVLELRELDLELALGADRV